MTRQTGKTETIYRVTFERIGRTRDVPPLTATVTARPDDHADQLAEAVWRYARKFLASRDVETQVDLPTAEKPAGEVMIFCGFQSGGKGTVTVVEPDPVTAPVTAETVVLPPGTLPSERV